MFVVNWIMFARPGRQDQSRLVSRSHCQTRLTSIENKVVIGFAYSCIE